jgi:hypothetical protein
VLRVGCVDEWAGGVSGGLEAIDTEAAGGLDDTMADATTSTEAKGMLAVSDGGFVVRG